MDFVNKGLFNFFKTILYIIIGLALVYLIISILPLAILVIAVIYLGTKAFKIYNRKIEFKKKRRNSETSEGIQKESNAFDISFNDVIDVDYKEVK